jgi:hypothetical protein
MDFRAAARRTATENLSGSNLSSDLNMDPTMQEAHDPSMTVPHGDSVVHTDGADPASPGGPAPYNAAEPVEGQPVVDDPLWRDQSPSDDDEDHRGAPIPNSGPGTDEDKTTLHNARLASYQDKAERYGR